MAALGSVGIGSGVLTSDILDQLKEAEKSSQINPIDRSITKNTAKTEALDLLTSLTSTLKSSAFSMKDSSLYQKRTVSGTNDDIEVTARDGVGIQEFSIKDVKLAQKNVLQSGSFTSEDSKVASGDGSFALNIDGTDYKIEYTADTSYAELKTKINDVAGDDVTASILQTGDKAFSFIISSDETGKDQQITIFDFDKKLDTTLSTNQLESGEYTSENAKIASDTGSLSLIAGEDSFNFDYDSNTSLTQLAEMINNDAGASQKVFATVVKNKYDDSNNNENTDDDRYSLIITAKNPTGDKPIEIIDHDNNLNDDLVTDNIRSGDFKKEDSKVATGSGAFSLSIGDSNINFKYDDTTTLKDLANLINNDSTASQSVYANVVEDDGMYNLVIAAKDTSKNEEINIIDYDNKLDSSLVTDNIRSGNFDAADSKIATDAGNSTLSLSIGSDNINIDYDENTTLTDLADLINNDATASQSVYANVVKNDEGMFNLVIAAKDTSVNQSIGIVDYDGKLDDLLKSDILKSDAMSSKTDSIATGAAAGDNFTLNIGADNFTISYDDTTSLEDLVTAINSDAGASEQVFASIITNPDGNYNLLLTAKEGFEDKALSITDDSANLDIGFTEDSGSMVKDSGTIADDSGTLVNNKGGMVDIQSSRDASFKYNGINMTRSKNTIDDIQLGLEIKLLKDDASANISITQDTQPIKDELENFVSSFNTMQKQIDTMTLADLDAKKVGVFNGNNSINSISRSLKKLLTERDSETGFSLANFGLEMDRTGKLSLNSSALDDKLKDDPTSVANFFSGKTTVVGDFDKYKDSFVRFAQKEDITFKELEDRIDDGTYDLNDKLFDNEDFTFDDIKDFTNGEVTSYNYKMDSTTHKDGVFEKLYTNLKNLNTLGGTILSISDGLSKEGKQLEENREKSLISLNARYDTMTSRFIQYDSMINSLNNQFASLQQQISMAVNGS